MKKILMKKTAVSEDEDDEDVDLAALDIEENGDQDSSRGRPSNVSLNDFEWSSVRSDIEGIFGPSHLHEYLQAPKFARLLVI